MYLDFFRNEMSYRIRLVVSVYTSNVFEHAFWKLFGRDQFERLPFENSTLHPSSLKNNNFKSIETEIYYNVFRTTVEQPFGVTIWDLKITSNAVFITRICIVCSYNVIFVFFNEYTSLTTITFSKRIRRKKFKNKNHFRRTWQSLELEANGLQYVRHDDSAGRRQFSARIVS